MYYDKEGQRLTMREWTRLLNDFDYRQIGNEERDGVRVSTVWLGLDHGFGIGNPLIFETMVFGGERDQDQRRYSTLEEAEAGHAQMVEEVFDAS